MVLTTCVPATGETHESVASFLAIQEQDARQKTRHQSPALRLLEYNRPQGSREIIVRPGSEEQPVLGAIVSEAVAEIDGPTSITS